MQAQFIHFLQEELAISQESIELAWNNQQPSCLNLSLILWSCGLITLRQLELMCCWLEKNHLNLTLEQAVK
jgi:hypothetical protein